MKIEQFGGLPLRRSSAENKKCDICQLRMALPGRSVCQECLLSHGDTERAGSDVGRKDFRPRPKVESEMSTVGPENIGAYYERRLEETEKESPTRAYFRKDEDLSVLVTPLRSGGISVVYKQVEGEEKDFIAQDMKEAMIMLSREIGKDNFLRLYPEKEEEIA